MALADLLHRPERLAAIRFCQECLATPVSMETPAGDPQLEQIQELLPDAGTILDFGAGKARLLHQLQESEQLKKYQYFAYDPAYRTDRDSQSSVLKGISNN